MLARATRGLTLASPRHNVNQTIGCALAQPSSGSGSTSRDHGIAPTSVSRTVLVARPIDRCEPVSILFSLSGSHFEIEGLNAFRQRANLAGAESIVVEREHRGHFRTTATKEGLVGNVDLGPVNLALDDG